MQDDDILTLCLIAIDAVTGVATQGTTPEARLADLGLDELDFAGVALWIEERHPIIVDWDTTPTTLADLMAAIRAGMTAP